MKNKLNENGILQFNQYLEELAIQPDKKVPYGLLDNPETSTPNGFSINFDPDLIFNSRHECGNYVAETIKSVEQRYILNDSGFWSALALLWFDQLCPKDKNNSRKPSKNYNYILSEDYRHYTRHSIRTAWQLASMYADDARYLQGTPMFQRGDLIEQLLGRQYYVDCKGVMLTASKLYTDNNTKSFKKGSTSSMRNYVRWLKQVRLTYDLFSISEDDLFVMLPAEFSRYKV